MNASTLRTWAVAFGTAAALLGATLPAAGADDGHWRHPRHEWHAPGRHRGPPVVVYGYPPPVVLAPPAVYAPPPVVYAPPPAGLSIVLPIRIR